VAIPAQQPLTLPTSWALLPKSQA